MAATAGRHVLYKVGLRSPQTPAKMSLPTATPTPIQKFVGTKVAVSKPIKEKKPYGVKAFFKYNGGPVRFVLPELRAPWGARISDQEFGGNVEVNLAFDDTNPEAMEAKGK